MAFLVSNLYWVNQAALANLSKCTSMRRLPDTKALDKNTSYCTLMIPSLPVGADECSNQCQIITWPPDTSLGLQSADWSVGKILA